MSTARKIAPGTDEFSLETTVKDAEAVHQLHLEIHRKLADCRFLYRRNLQFFQAVAESRGHIVGAYHRGRLIGYAVFLKPGEVEGGHAELIRHLGVEPASLAEFAGAAIHPDFRGRGLFRQIIRRRFDLAKELGIQFTTTAVWPGNTAVLRTLLREDCVIVGTLRDADGANYLLLKSITTPLDIDVNAGIRVRLDDRAGNLECLESGVRIGCADLTASPTEVVYVSIKDLSIPRATPKGLG